MCCSAFSFNLHFENFKVYLNNIFYVLCSSFRNKDFFISLNILSVIFFSFSDKVRRFFFFLPENKRLQSKQTRCFAATYFVFIYLGSKVHASYARTTLRDPTLRECLTIVAFDRSQILFRVHALTRARIARIDS